MKCFQHKYIIQIILFYFLASILTACVGDTKPSSQLATPTISLLSVTPKEVVFSGTGGDIPITLQLCFNDLDANILNYTITTKDAAGNIITTKTGTISSILGLISGSITLAASVHANITGLYSFSVLLTDATGLQSNVLTETCTVFISIAANVLTPSSSNLDYPGVPAVSYDGNQYLIVYHYLDGSNDTIRGTFVTKTGSVVKDFHIGPSNASTGNPVVSFDGVNHLVVFSYYGVLRGQRVTQAGDVLDGETGFFISPGCMPAIAFDGTNYLVVLCNYTDSNGYDIYATLISPKAEVFGEFVVTDREQGQLSPKIAFDGLNYLVVWQDAVLASGPQFHIYGTWINKNGVVINVPPFAIATLSGTQQSPEIAFDGTNFFVVWAHTDETSPSSFAIYKIMGKRISKDGTIIDGDASSEGIAINTSPYIDKCAHSVIFDGTDYFIAWAYGHFSNDPPSGIYGAKVSAAGILQGEPDNLGIALTGTSMDGYYLFPIMCKSDINKILVWGNFWTSIDSSNSVRGILINHD